jgi:cyclopropane fatty-acyl-phospholipid synthase-like methyltransferase
MEQMERQVAERHNDFQRQYYSRAPRGTIAHTESPYIQRHLDEVLRIADLRPGARILDAGCGMGRHSVLLAARGFDVEGLELSPHLLELMRRNVRFPLTAPISALRRPRSTRATKPCWDSSSCIISRTSKAPFKASPA